MRIFVHSVADQKDKKGIKCFLECEFLKQGEEYQTARKISQEVNTNFNTKAEDIFQYDNDAIAFVFPLEEFFADKFYQEKFNDNDIYKALSKIYSHQTKRADFLKAENACEKLIFEKIKELDNNFPDISAEIKRKSILRILKSIKLSSGKVLGNRNYLEMIYSQTHKDGKWNWMFSDLKD